MAKSLIRTKRNLFLNMDNYLLLDNQRKSSVLEPFSSLNYTDGIFYFEWKNPFSIEKINTSFPGLWRYAKWLPVDYSQNCTLGEGYTPLIKLTFFGKEIFVKQEQLFPTGSYKDRGASVMIRAAIEQGVSHVIQDSSGNAGCAVAAYAARAGISCEIFVPESTSQDKLTQIVAYGAHLNKISGDRTATAKAALQAAKAHYYASHCYNPFFYEGTKTFAYETVEQLGWRAPDAVVLPAGNGTLIIGAYLGFKHLLSSGIIDKMPRIIGVQARNCAPLFQQWKGGERSNKFEDTLAEGIAIPFPVRAKQMIEIIEETKGAFITVTETQIKDTLGACIQNGFYIEPTSAATIAGLEEAFETFDEKNWVTLFSGHGLKSGAKLNALFNQKH